LTFLDARCKLLTYVRNQVSNGELTERSFARFTGISQPHAHNVLKGVRTLSPEMFDLLLRYFHLSLLDLAPIEDIEAQLQRRRMPERCAEIAFLECPIGPGRTWHPEVNWRKTFPRPFPSGDTPQGLVMASLVTDPAMMATLGSYDIALLDTTDYVSTLLSPYGLYVIERRQEVVLRYIRSGARCYYLATDASLDNPADWELLELSSAELSEAVKARVCWLGHERDRDAFAQTGRLLHDAISS
jgi:hypothetical protein